MAKAPNATSPTRAVKKWFASKDSPLPKPAPEPARTLAVVGKKDLNVIKKN